LRKKELPPSASARFSGPVRFILSRRQISLPEKGTCARSQAYHSAREHRMMLVERGLQVMNVEVVGDAYAIASNYLRRTGAIPDTIATNDRLLQIILELFQRGEFNKIRLANRAIARFEADEFV
jgi:hypothetical protein